MLDFVDTLGFRSPPLVESVTRVNNHAVGFRAQTREPPPAKIAKAVELP